ncbi:MAG: phosphate ABC transporter permease PstA [Clostridia bacterium]
MMKKPSNLNTAKYTDRFMTAVFYSVGGFFLLLIFVLAGYIIFNGALSFKPEYLTFTSDGVMNQLFDTVYLVFLSLLISTPLGILAGIYMAEYAKKNKLTEFIRISIEALSSLPSLVVGLFVMFLFILVLDLDKTLFVGAIAVSILSVPLITTTTEDALRSLPPEYKQGSMGLGATHWQTITKVMLPACISRIITGIILAAGRGFGEAAALLFTTGQSSVIRWTDWDLTSKRCPLNPFRPAQTLSLQIWEMKTESIRVDKDDVANFASALLVILVLTFSLLARYVSGRIDKKAQGGK